MSTTAHASDSTARPIRDRFGFPHLLAATLVLVGATILLGVAAKATGSGLGCEANWPQCDAGPYNLFPAHIVSFYEWFHRFVSMFAGFAIVGTALTSLWASSADRRVTALVVLGAVLTPIQVVLGWQTVEQYTMDVLSLHFWTAILIFTLFVVATVLVWEPRLTTSHVTSVLVLGAASVPLHVALSPVFLTDITSYPPRVQVAQYAVSLAIISSTIVAAMVARHRFDRRRVRGVLSSLPILGFLAVFFGRQSGAAFDQLLDLTYLSLVSALFVAICIGVWLTRTDSTE